MVKIEHPWVGRIIAVTVMIYFTHSLKKYEKVLNRLFSMCWFCTQWLAAKFVVKTTDNLFFAIDTFLKIKFTILNYGVILWKCYEGK